MQSGKLYITQLKRRISRRFESIKKWFSQKVTPRYKNFFSTLWRFVMNRIDIEPIAFFLVIYSVSTLPLHKQLFLSIGLFYVLQYLFLKLTIISRGILR